MRIDVLFLWRILAFAALFSCVSVAATNLFLILGILVYLILIYNRKIDVMLVFSNTGSKLIMLFFVVLIMCGLVGLNPLLSVRETWQVYIYRMIPFFLVGGLSKIISRKQFECIFLCLFSSLTVTSIVAIFQFINGNTRPNGLASHIMHLAGYYVILLPVFLIFVLDNVPLNWLKRKNLLLLPFAICVAGFIANNTRGAWVAAGLVSILILVLLGIRYPRKFICGVCVICLSMACLSNNELFVRRFKSITSTTNSSNAERILIWNSAFQMIADYPVLGLGPGGFTELYQKKYISPKAKNPELRHCHNLFLQIMTENVVIGLISFLALYLYFVWYGFKEYIKKKKYAGLILASVVLSVMIQGMTEFNASVFKDMWLMIGLCYFDLLNGKCEKNSENV